jgi:hypothetical protein
VNIKPIFEAKNGEKFNDAASAQRHNEFLEARDSFDAAWRVLKRAAIKEYKTADGYDFDDGAGYWWNEKCFLISDKYSLYPGIAEIQLYPREITDISINGGELKITARIYGYGNGDLKTFNLSDLYKKRANAEIRLAEILRERISELQEQLTSISPVSGQG